MSGSLAVAPFDAAAILIVLAAVLGYLNHRYLRLPQSVGLTVMGAVASVVVVGVDLLVGRPTQRTGRLRFDGRRLALELVVA